MMDKENRYNPKLHHRRSIRLQGYDYSKAGTYFITVCIKDKLHLLGEVVNDHMVLNDAGSMLDRWLQRLSEKFPFLQLDECQIMPNHFHAILKIVDPDTNSVLVDAHIKPNSPANPSNTVGVDPCVNPNTREEPTILNEHINSPLYHAIRWLKTMSTNEYIRNVRTNDWLPFKGKLFQRNYWEHIIRNESEYNNIATYIRNNPANWGSDKLY